MLLVKALTERRFGASSQIDKLDYRLEGLNPQKRALARRIALTLEFTARFRFVKPILLIYT